LRQKKNKKEGVTEEKLRSLTKKKVRFYYPLTKGGEKKRGRLIPNDPKKKKDMALPKKKNAPGESPGGNPRRGGPLLKGEKKGPGDEARRPGWKKTHSPAEPSHRGGKLYLYSSHRPEEEGVDSLVRHDGKNAEAPPAKPPRRKQGGYPFLWGKGESFSTVRGGKKRGESPQQKKANLHRGGENSIAWGVNGKKRVRAAEFF